MAITPIDTVSIPYFAISDITPSQCNFNSGNTHTRAAFYISKVISDRKKQSKAKQKPNP